MRKLFFGLVLSVILFLTFFQERNINSISNNVENQEEVILLEVNAKAALENVPRLGLDFGQWTSWGSEQLCSNIIQNPGCEGTIERTVVVVTESDSKSFSDDAEWLARADGFWEGAQYFIRTGPSAGATGIISYSLGAGKNKFPEYFSDQPIPTLDKHDIVILSKYSTEQGLWIQPSSVGQVLPDADHRTNSPGVQCIAFNPKKNSSAEIYYHFDTIGPKAGKMLPINGKWKLSFWIKSEGKNGRLEFSFFRDQSPPFVQSVVHPTSTWEQKIYHFDAHDTGPDSVLKLRINTVGEDVRILLDDLELISAENESFPFRKEVVDSLKKLRPAYLRTANMANALENCLAVPFARRNSRMLPPTTGAEYTYSLIEFLDLCHGVGANPWICVPVMFSESEYQDLGKFLAEYTDHTHFDEVLIEFGNENWNHMFRPQGIPFIPQHGQMADSTFKNISEGAGPKFVFKKIVNGQYVSPNMALQFANSSPLSNALAIAPYYLFNLDAGLTDVERLKALFESDSGFLKEQANNLRNINKELMVYEVNAHTTGGTATETERNALVAGMASGSALAKRLLEAMHQGVRRQCVFNFLGFEIFVTDRALGNARLWGVKRDIGSTNRLRPTGLALTMLNHVLEGNMHRLDIVDKEQMKASEITSAAFQTPTGWGAVLISSHESPLEVDVKFPGNDTASLPNTYLLLDAQSPFDTNEDKETVKITEHPLEVYEHNVRVKIPAWGLVVLLPKEKM